MCGIAGYLGPSTVDLNSLAGVLDQALVHRGPDDAGRQVLSVPRIPGQSVLLVNRRLAIIDLSPLGHQPMRDGAAWIVYNGEIYNHQTLREALRHAGVSFASQSDTEVILKGYTQRGRKILDDLCGMFAMAIWDGAKQELLLAVDPLGIKPLYYWTGGDGRFLFASELQAILRTGMVARDVDPVALEGYLSYGAVQGPNTVIRDVRLLPAGCYMTVRADGSVDGPHPYWEPSYAAADEAAPADVDDVVDELRELFDTVVREHLISDVPLGIFLSGGIDSSSILASASRWGQGLRTFSVVYEESEFSEAPYSREMAKRYRSHHTELCLSPRELLKLLPRALDAMDQPTIDGMNAYVISGAVRRAGVTVVLSGQGGDETFGGYPTFRQVLSAARWRRRFDFIPRPGWRALGAIWSTAQSRRRVLPDKIGEYLLGDGSSYSTYLLLRQLFPPSTRRALYHTANGACWDGLPEAAAGALRAAARLLDPVNLVSLMETRTYLGNMLLRDGDVMSMAHSLEMRVPFLDRRIVDRVARLPGTLKVDEKLPKPLLLRMMGDRLPSMVYLRPKQGFTFPWEYWLRRELRPMAQAALSDAATFDALGVDFNTVRRLWEAFLAARPGITWSRIWALIVLREWAVRHLAVSRPEAVV
jgi:asparagine synthase (glutamine-hydrolysing)